ncbi:hypothetical protein AVEN_219120-1 [Araneus ventricosus]|uniref:Uncharacterized protein n=1 Tax=Araneus ventricosus TaxID=182803 RepID=A0A4Y2ULJ3_ARAVE|nr:hypothetical protein AVEN_244424-1 [Araneus ventricosus]GBO12427.1 hypothetical protein AVEN_219120-1 [Araneus ventricosus]
METILFFNVTFANVEALIPSFYQSPNSSCKKFFGLLSHTQKDFVLNVVIICKSVCLHDVVLVDQTDENRLGLSLVGQCYSIHLTAQT